MIGISACLGGLFCRYDGNTQELTDLRPLIEAGQAQLICPEVLGGLPTPRKPAEIIGGDGFDVWQGQAQVVNTAGVDVTEAYKNGAQKAYQQLQAQGIQQVILKERSPSCGSQLIYDGSFSGTRINGVGVATAYFLKRGITVYTEDNYHELLDGLAVTYQD